MNQNLFTLHFKIFIKLLFLKKIQVIANSGDLMEITKEHLPVSSISVFIVGFVVEQVKSDNIFKSIRVAVTEFIGGGNAGKKFYIKCRYIKSDERIDKKVSVARKNSNVMISGELILDDSEFQVDIQDLNFLATSVANIESLATSSQYSWSTARSSGRISAQEMASIQMSHPTNELSANRDTMEVSQNEEIGTSQNEREAESFQNEEESEASQNEEAEIPKHKKKRKRGLKRY